MTAQKIQGRFQTLTYPYFFSTTEDVSKPLGDYYTSSFYAWNFCAVRSMSLSVSPTLASSAGPHTFVIANVESSAKDAVEAFIKKDRTGNAAVVCIFDPHIYKREENLLTTYRLDRVQKPSRVVSQKHQDDLLESLRVNSVQYGARLMTVGEPAVREAQHCQRQQLA